LDHIKNHQFIFGLLIFAGIILYLCLFNTGGLIPLSAVPQSQQRTGNTAAPSGQNPNQPINAVTQTAINLGVQSSIPRINQVSTFLMADNQSGIFILPPKNPPDQHIFSTSFEIIRSDNSIIYASANFFPNQEAVYDMVEYVDISSEELEKTVFKNLKRVGVLKKNIVLLDGGAVKVFLMPAGRGTVVIKKEVVQ